jgi:hypothetical protein
MYKRRNIIYTYLYVIYINIQETEGQMERLHKKGTRELHTNDDVFIQKMRPGIILTQV